MRGKPRERGIEQTLRDLNIPTDVSPAAAAQEAAAEAASDGDGDEEGQELDQEDEQRLSQQQAGVAVADDLDDGEGGDGEGNDGPAADDMPFPNPLMRPSRLDPAVVPNPTTPRQGRGKPREKPRGVTMSKSLIDKVPGAEKVMVYKRVEGKRWFVHEYQREDLNTFANFEAFLTRYVRPKHGPGEYDLVGVDGRGNNHELGQVRLIEDGSARNSPESSAMQLVEKMMNENRDRDEKWMQQQRTGQQDPLQLLAGVMTLKKELEGEASGGMASVLKEAMLSGKDSSNQMMTMMMAMMQQSNQMVMALLSKPKDEDPIMKVLLAKLLDGGGMGGGGSAMPMPPPPPPQNSLSEVLTAMAAFMGAMAPGGGGDEDYKELVKTLLLQSQGEKMSLKDTIALAMQLTAPREGAAGGSGGFKETIDNLAAVMNIAQNISRQNEPGAAAGLWDAMASLFSNRDFAGSIAQAVRLKMDAKNGTDQQRLEAEAQRLRMERRLLEQEKARLIASGGTPQTQVVTAPPRDASTTPTAEHVRPTSAPRPTPFKPRATPEQVQAAAQQEIQRTGKIPELPANTYEHVNNILSAPDDGDRLGKTITLLMYFAEFPDWKPFSENLLSLVRNGDRAQAMKYLVALFEGLAAIGMFPAENIAPLMEILNEHFVTLQEQMMEFVAAAEEHTEVTGTQLSQPPDAQEADAPAAES